MRIVIKAIPHNKQRYDTCGDWVFNTRGDLEITVSKMEDWRLVFLVGLHEAIEAAICRYKDIREEDVTAFDIAYTGDGEPGNDPRAPYKWPHRFATLVEWIVSKALGVNWKQYEKTLGDLF